MDGIHVERPNDTSEVRNHSNAVTMDVLRTSGANSIAYGTLSPLPGIGGRAFASGIAPAPSFASERAASSGRLRPASQRGDSGSSHVNGSTSSGAAPIANITRHPNAGISHAPDKPASPKPLVI